jgi:hypothetical protein
MLRDNKMYFLLFNHEGVIHITPPSDEGCSAEVIAERFSFLRAVAPALARFHEDLIAAAVQAAIDELVIPTPVIDGGRF